MAQTRAPAIRWRFRKENQDDTQLPYFETALDQLVTSLLLEENQVILTSIHDSLRQLSSSRPRRVLERLYQANLNLQRDVVVALEDLFAVLEPERSELDKAHWELAEALSGYKESVLQELVKWSGRTFSDRLKTTSLVVMQSGREPPNEDQADSEHKKSDQKKDRQFELSKVQHILRVNAQRLRANAGICSLILQSYSFSYLASPEERVQYELKRRRLLGPFTRSTEPSPVMDLSAVFLVGENISGAWLTGSDLGRALLSDVELSQAQLQNTDLIRAQLQGAHGF